MTDDKKRFVLNTLKAFISAWEKSENNALRSDTERKINQLTLDPAADAELQQHIAEEIERTIDDAVQAREEQFIDDEEKDLATGAHRLQL